MDTDSMFQLIDRQAIAVLKDFHFTKAGNEEAAALAREQANDLAVAGDVLVWECLRGKRVPPVQPHLRYHDHSKVEGWRLGKEALEDPNWTSLMRFAGELALIHARYWEKQSRVQWLKERIRSEAEGSDMKAYYEHEFCATQREIDLCNEYRNRLIAKGDELFARMIDIAKVNQGQTP